ncbi:unnamed protein product [Spodoptera littoralis]|uniref:Serine protease K12H4.7 n=1 Tax=Spodoptera littoralis TaxID=7109 RepID=A0A9P0I7N2_SPOLI|nr:unnamed protein product [Spodoptera littoralis]CAH1642578.1 unnamed protein product [Spodoptera littoralis]
MWLLLLLISPCLAQFQLHREPPLPDGVPFSSRAPTMGWVNVRLNHFMAYDTRTFQMRYYYNNQFANVENPNIVIFVGGEWAIGPGYVQSGLAYEMAQEMNAGLFYTEHRYYGQTQPFPDSSVENLSFLNIDQALGDLAQFIQHVKSDAFEDGHYRNASVALVGCSYAGTMATWMRMAYPHLVNAAFSDSAPLQAQEEFPEYLEVVAKALAEQGGQQCVDAVAAGVQGVLELLATPAGAAQVSEIFQTCTPINTASPLDVATFFSSGIINYFAYMVQYAIGNRIANSCNVLVSSSEPDAVRRLAALVAGDNCVETRYLEAVALYRNTSFASPDSTIRLWLHQTCVEYGWYQTTAGSNHPFMDTLPLEFYHQLCKDIFSNNELDFDEQRLRAGIERTNILFGGWSHMPDRVVSVAGTHDPWSPMGPNESHSHHNAPVYVVPNISHCRVIAPSVLDSQELVRVRRAVMDHMYEFTTGDSLVTEPDPTTEAPTTTDAPDSATGIAASSFMLLLTILALV